MLEACIAGCGESGTGSGERNSGFCQGKRLRVKVKEKIWKKKIKVYNINVKKGKKRNGQQIEHLDGKCQVGNR